MVSPSRRLHTLRKYRRHHYSRCKLPTKAYEVPCLSPKWPAKPKWAMRRLGLSLNEFVCPYPAHYAKSRPRCLPEYLLRYDAQRYTLFSRFDQGIHLDDAMWYSVTPEPVAHAQATHISRSGAAGGRIIVDGFCGAGGNAIQFALARFNSAKCRTSVTAVSSTPYFFVLGFDILSSRLCMARHNAEIYGAAGLIDFIQADFRSCSRLLRHSALDGVFLSPPWVSAGVVPREKGAFSVRELAQGLDGKELIAAAKELNQSIAFFLPRATRKHELRALAVLAKSDVLIHKHYRTVSGVQARKATAITCYFGDWAGCQLNNIDCDSQATRSSTPGEIQQCLSRKRKTLGESLFPGRLQKMLKLGDLGQIRD